MNVLIIDDDNMFIEKLKLDILTYFNPTIKDFKFEVKYNNFFCIESEKIDIAFLDIDLKTCNGINLAKMLRKQFPNIIIIFVSAREELVFKTLTIGIFQFIRKSKYEHDSIATFSQLETFIRDNFSKKVINVNGRKHLIKVDEIYYIISIGHDIIIHLENEAYTIKGSLKDIMSYLESPNLIQIQRNLAINYYYVKELSRAKIKGIDDQVHTVGRKYQKELLMQYEDFLLR